LNKIGVYGAEIPVSLVFADIRGSTTISEGMSPTEYHAFLDRFYRIASSAILENDGLVDKFVGDEVIGLFFRGISGVGHAAAAIHAAQALLDAVGQGDGSDYEAIPVGAAVHSGEAFVGSTGAEGVVNDFTALGDVVNTTARLASEAVAGELLVSEDAAVAAGFEIQDQTRRTIMIRGRSSPVTVYSLASHQPSS
jgi:adenylate cyclase